MASALHNTVDSPDALKAARASGDEDRLVEVLRSTKTLQHGLAAQVVQILQETESPKVRNAAAIALADMRAPNAANVLIKMLDRPETRNSRGTLLYALEEIEGKVPIGILVDTIVGGSYEARQEAVRFITSRNVKFNETELRDAINKLRALSPSNEEHVDSIKRILAEISILVSNFKRKRRWTLSSKSKFLSSKSKKNFFIVRRSEGDFAVRRSNSKRASVVANTQEEAIAIARKMEPSAKVLVERVRYTSTGRPDKWRKP
jgi:Uncharacterized protein conserved in bacteria (DUF2188)